MTDARRAVLYARVSTAEQAERGYSLRQQLDRLREYAAGAGWEVVEEITDPGYSGASLVRPGLDKVRDLVAAGSVDVVLGQDMDRLSRDPAHMLLLERELERKGCELQALDSWGDGSPQSDMLRTIRSAVSKYERDLVAERSRRNKLSKAREGKVVGGHNLAYGFSFATDAEGKVCSYEVHEPAMAVVRRIFSEIAAGKGIRTIKNTLDREHVPTPGRGASWSRPFIKALVSDELYRPHGIGQLRELGVQEKVLETLTEGSYGLYRYQGIPVPIPDAGVPLETVERARAAVGDNRSPSKAASRFWQLSGGLLRCAECGRAMQPLTVRKNPERPYFYYRCQSTRAGDADPCTNRKVVPAERIEREVWEFVSGYVDDPDTMLEIVGEIARRDVERARSAGEDAKALAARREELEKRAANYQRAFAADALSLEDLRARTAEMDEERRCVERELERVTRSARDVGAVRAGYLRVMEEIRHDAGRHSQITEEIEQEFGEDLSEADTTPPAKRHERYRQLQVRVEVGPDCVPHVSGAFDPGISVCHSESWIARKSAAKEQHPPFRPPLS